MSYLSEARKFKLLEMHCIKKACSLICGFLTMKTVTRWEVVIVLPPLPGEYIKGVVVVHSVPSLGNQWSFVFLKRSSSSYFSIIPHQLYSNSCPPLVHLTPGLLAPCCLLVGLVVGLEASNNWGCCSSSVPVSLSLRAWPNSFS